jgi:protein CpxP
MKPVFKSLVVTSLLASAAFAAFAQAPTPATTPTAEQRPLRGERGMGQHEGRDGMRHMDPAKMEAMVAKRNAALKAQLKITPEQEGAWTAYTTATKPPSKMDHKRPDREELAKLTTPERIDKMRALRDQHHKDMQAAMDRRDDATKTFYAALNAEQKKTFDNTHAKKHGSNRPLAR